MSFWLWVIVAGLAGFAFMILRENIRELRRW